MSGGTREDLVRALGECQRKGERRSQEIIALLDQQHRHRHEIRRLEKKLRAIHRKSESPEIVRDIVRSAIGRQIDGLE